MSLVNNDNNINKTAKDNTMGLYKQAYDMHKTAGMHKQAGNGLLWTLLGLGLGAGGLWAYNDYNKWAGSNKGKGFGDYLGTRWDDLVKWFKGNKTQQP